VTAWQIDRLDASPEQARPDTSEVPLKWAHDARTGEPRYIHDDEVVEHKCTCICPACQLNLTPVMPGQPLHARPTAHFRHPPGAQKDACVIVAARLAATHLLQEQGFIDLPRRTMSRTATGFSGQGYQVWVEAPAERRMIKGARLQDHATAELTLDDGRTLLVDLTGRRDTADGPGGQAMVTISLSAPDLAMLSPEEIRARLRILPDIRWCSHWNDRTLAAQGDAEAVRAAHDALDEWDATDEADFRSSLTSDLDEATVQGLRRETLLHREVKAILERAHRIATPGLEVSVKREPPDEFSGEWETDTLRMTWFAPPKKLELTDVQLEQRLGRIVPDVIANLDGSKIFTTGISGTWVNDDFEEEIEDTFSLPWPSTLLVEVTVTHGIDEEKLQRVRQLNIATLEIDLSKLGGRLTREALSDLVVHQTLGKRWVHHPIFSIKEQRLNAVLNEHPVSLRYKERLFELMRPHWLARPVSDWTAHYLDAVTAFHDANVRIRRAQRRHQGDGPEPTLLGTQSDEWTQIMEAASALSAHALQGADDPALLDESGLISRLLSIQQNKGVGYDVSTGYQVLNAIMQSGKHNKRWDSLYAVAVKAYELETHFTEEQTRKYKAWRQALIDRIDADDEAYLRPATFDALLSALFPEMAEGIGKGYGRVKEQK